MKKSKEITQNLRMWNSVFLRGIIFNKSKIFADYLVCRDFMITFA